MKIISLWEPWATLLSLGHKKIETRSWGTSYRGWLAIHAAKRWTADQRELLVTEPFMSALPVDWRIEPGCVVGVVNFTHCLPTEARIYVPGVFEYFPKLDTDQERAFGNYDPGRYGWVTTSAFRLPEPIPLRGQQGLWDAPPEVVAEIQRQWKGLAA